MSTVLLVDDEKNVLKTLSISLRRYDFAVQQAQTGPDALKLLEESPCDFVVSDIRMAPMDGYKLASAIRRRYPEMPVIFMTAFANEDANGLSEDLAGLPRLTKPFPVMDLIRLLHDKEKERRGGTAPNAGSAKILLFDEGTGGEAVCASLQSMGFRVDRAAPELRSESAIDWNRYDLIALDECVLESGSWILLNQIDQYAPWKPVLLISNHENPPRSGAWKDVAVAVIHRELLFQEAGRARALILDHMKSEQLSPPVSEPGKDVPHP
jgi:DNA-binding NtrC family response regulator